MLLRALADRISEVTCDALPAQAVDVAKQGVLDTVGVTLAGAPDETTAVFASALRKSTGLMLGATFGRLAGRSAAAFAQTQGAAASARA